LESDSDKGRRQPKDPPAFLLEKPVPGGRTAKRGGRARDADSEAGPTLRLLDALDGVRRETGEAVSSADLLAALHGKAGCEGVKSFRRLAALLGPLGLARRQVWNGGARRWCYVLDEKQLADLGARYGG
jgi:hypothetical protein